MFKKQLLNIILTNKKVEQYLYFVFLTVFFFMSSFFSQKKEVYAQEDTVISVTPSVAQIVINENDEITINLLVENIKNLNSFELKITYDPEFVEFVSWVKGDPWYWNANPFIEELNPGSIFLVFLRYGDPAYFELEELNLLQLKFKGIKSGNSPIHFEQAKFVLVNENGEFFSIYPQHIDGLINTFYDPNLLPKSTLSGTLQLQGQPDVSGVEITLLPGQAYAIGPYTATTTTTGSYDFDEVVQDSYIITTAQPGYLNLSAELGKIIDVSTTTTTINPLRLIGGNAVWQEEVDGEMVLNQEIDIFDVALIAGELYGQQGENLPGDVNGDGVINIIDLALVKGNFGLTAAAAYQNWQP